MVFEKYLYKYSKEERYIIMCISRRGHQLNIYEFLNNKTFPTQKSSDQVIKWSSVRWSRFVVDHISGEAPASTVRLTPRHASTTCYIYANALRQAVPSSLATYLAQVRGEYPKV